MVVERNYTYYGDVSIRYDEIVTRAGYDLGDRVCDWVEETRGSGQLEVLDLGIGTGLSSEKLACRGYPIIGVDASSDMLEVCRKKNFCKSLYCADLSNGSLPEFPVKFDVVVCFGLIEFVRNVELFFSSVAAVMAPSGVFVLAVRDLMLNPLFTEMEWQGLNIDRRAYEDVGLVVIHHSRERVDAALVTSGLAIVKEFDVLAYRSPTQDIDTRNRIIVCSSGS